MKAYTIDNNYYIKKLGLEESHNGIWKQSNQQVVYFTDEVALKNEAMRMLNWYDKTYKDIPFAYAIMYIIFMDGTVRVMLPYSENDFGTMRIPVAEARAFAMKNAAITDYMMLAEVAPSRFAVISDVA